MILKLTKHCHKAKSGTNHTHCIQENPYKTLDLAGWSNTDHNRQCRFSCKSKRLYKHALSLSLSLKHTYTHINLSKQPPVFFTISKSKGSAASVFGNSQTTSAECSMARKSLWGWAPSVPAARQTTTR